MEEWKEHGYYKQSFRALEFPFYGSRHNDGRMYGDGVGIVSGQRD